VCGPAPRRYAVSAAPEGCRIVNERRAGPGCGIRSGPKPVSANVRAAPIVGTLGRDEEHPAATSTTRQAQRARPTSPQASLWTVPSAHLAAAWETPPAVLIAAALAALLFVQAFVRLRRRRREHAPWTRAALFAAGLALLVLPLVSPLDEAGDDRLLSAHMLQHVLIGDAAAALLVVSVRGPLLFFLLPPSLLRPLAAFRPLRAFLSLLLRPLVSLGLWTAAILVWHVPRVYDYAAAHPFVHDLEHLSFVVAGVLVWTQLVDPARHGRLRRPQRIFFALAMLALTQPIVDTLLFSSAPRYDRYANLADRLFGLSPLTDQRLAGAVMMVEQLLTLGICVALLLRPYLQERRARARPALSHR
jgi:putative membrane protein